ncbi:septal ring lytic transglycosylase RlpA family protein [Ideonella sp. BN130291]|uniref:septal ring lytic transglycosylase RlpA family protein n=1 Tax=Ideonella sp. BN130291 TaxID=3112940 RepID=UPI002E26A081|nr:septal ring lytic transglycosylase RlpA family protein [Ideonella sp. BN130291]
MQQGSWARHAGALTLAAAALLAGCASAPPGGGTPAGAPRSSSPAPGRDGAEANPPPNLDRVPDAEPKLEAIRRGGPNKPYELNGKQYVPLAGDPPFAERGLASWYGKKFHGRPTASGELYDMYAMTAAHPTLPIPSYVRVRNPANGREVIVRVNDRGPFHSGRIIDLSYTAALKLDLLRGVRPVEIERITGEDIRTGAWRREGPGTTMLAKAAPAPVQAGEAPAVLATPAPAATPAPPSTTLALPAATAATPANTPTVVLTPTNGPANGTDSPAAASTPAASLAAAAPLASESAKAGTADARGFWIQLGAFRQSSGAMEFQRKVEQELDWLQPLLAVFNDRSVHKLQAGPYRSRSEASNAADRIRAALQLVPVIVERR